MDQRVEKLMAFLDASPSVYHATANLAAELESNGYAPLCEAQAWDLVPGGKYYVTRGGSAVIAFRIPKGNPKGFMMSSSHSDRPTFKLKENGELNGTYTRLSVERYGYSLLPRGAMLTVRICDAKAQAGTSRLLCDAPVEESGLGSSLSPQWPNSAHFLQSCSRAGSVRSRRSVSCLIETCYPMGKQMCKLIRYSPGKIWKLWE